MEQKTSREQIEDNVVGLMYDLVRENFVIHTGADVMSLIRIVTRLYALYLGEAYVMLEDCKKQEALDRFEADLPAHFKGLKALVQESIEREADAIEKITSSGISPKDAMAQVKKEKNAH